MADTTELNKTALIDKEHLQQFKTNMDAEIEEKLASKADKTNVANTYLDKLSKTEQVVTAPIKGTLNGNAASATKLQTARTINVQDSTKTHTGTGVSFNGTGNAVITLPYEIDLSTLNFPLSGGQIRKTGLTDSKSLTIFSQANNFSKPQITLDAVNNTINIQTGDGTTSKRYRFSMNGAEFSITGNAASATKLATKRTISVSGTGLTAAGQAFDGTGNITIPITLANALLALAGVTPSAGKIPVFTGANTASLASITDFMKTLLGKASAGDVRSAIGAVDASGAGVVAGDVSNANAWWVKLGGTIPLIIQGGFNNVGRRTDVTIAFPIAFAHVLSIVGLPVVNDSNSSGRGLENIKTYSTSSFVYYSGYDIDNKNLFWLAFGV